MTDPATLDCLIVDAEPPAIKAATKAAEQTFYASEFDRVGVRINPEFNPRKFIYALSHGEGSEDALVRYAFAILIARQKRLEGIYESIAQSCRSGYHFKEVGVPYLYLIEDVASYAGSTDPCSLIVYDSRHPISAEDLIIRRSSSLFTPSAWTDAFNFSLKQVPVDKLIEYTQARKAYRAAIIAKKEADKAAMDADTLRQHTRVPFVNLASELFGWRV